MENSTPQQPASPLSPAIRISRPEYAAIPARTSDDSAEGIQERRPRYPDYVDTGLGIQMVPMASPKSPGVSYGTHDHQDAGNTKPGMFSPSFSPGPRPLYARTPDTLYSFGSGISRARTDSMTERLIAHRATQSARWHVHWRIPALMVFGFVMGIVFALLQHFWYTYLHHTRVEDEDKKFRWTLYGRVLAYFSKVAFGGCVVLVFRQRIWTTFREHAWTVLSIDQMFGATEDPSLFTNWEAVSNAPIMVTIAMIIWLIPLATIIFSPGALTFGAYLDVERLDLTVPTINFTPETLKDWRQALILEDGTQKKSLVYYNTTDRSATTPGWFDYYDQPSADLRRIALLLAYSGMNHPNVKLGARQSACGGSYNCTYEQTFVGPGYQCEEVANSPDDTDRLEELGAPFDFDSLVPRGRKVYYADFDSGSYARPQTEFRKDVTGGIPIGVPPEDLGVFKAEPVLWIGYAFNSTEPIAKDDPFYGSWTHRYDPHIVRCTHMETRYVVKWNWTEPMFHSTATRKYLRPIVNTNFTREENGTVDYTKDPEPMENFVSPRDDVKSYKKTAAYHAMGDMLRDFLRGYLDVEPPKPGPYYTQVHSDITKTRLVMKSSEPKKNLTDEIEAFYSDMVLSLFSAPEMLVVANETVKVRRSQLHSSFVYVPERLWQCYAPVIFVTLMVLLYGAFTIWHDGTTFSTGFSRILVTTRNTTLDDISRGACLGNDPFPMELMRTRLKFGVLADGSEAEYVADDGYQGGTAYQGVGHCAFGVGSEIGPIQRGVPYAGLRRRKSVR